MKFKEFVNEHKVEVIIGSGLAIGGVIGFTVLNRRFKALWSYSQTLEQLVLRDGRDIMLLQADCIEDPQKKVSFLNEMLKLYSKVIDEEMAKEIKDIIADISKDIK